MTETDNEVPVICPRCGTADKPGAKPMIEVNNGNYTCIGCGHTFVSVHLATIEGSDETGFRAVCTCGWSTARMGQGNAWTSKEQHLDAVQR
jgi:DNA-directed RNA polymerase subunit RPC12/RpoP